MIRDKANTKKRLLIGAAETIVYQGVSRIGIRATGKRAGVDSDLIYRYFRNWHGLIEVLFEQMLARIVDTLNTESHTSPGNTLTNCEPCLLLFYRQAQADPAFQVLLRYLIDNQETELAHRLNRLLDEFIQKVSGKDGVETGILRLLIAGVTCTVLTDARKLNAPNDWTEQVIHRIFDQLNQTTHTYADPYTASPVDQ